MMIECADADIAIFTVLILLFKVNYANGATTLRDINIGLNSGKNF